MADGQPHAHRRSRLFLEDETRLLGGRQRPRQTSPKAQLRAMRTFGTTVLFQPINDNDVDAAFELGPGLAQTTSYLGVEVLQARRALAIDGLELGDDRRHRVA